MKIQTKDTELWYEKYRELNDELQNKYLIETLKTPLSEEFIKDISIIDFLIELFEGFMKKKQYEKMIETYEVIEENNPQILKEDFFYVDKNFVDYYLFMNDERNLHKHIKSYTYNPEKAVDNLIPLVKNLCNYGYDDIAYEISKEVYIEVRDADNIIAGTEREFSEIIFMKELEKLYIDIKESNPIEKDKTIDLLEEYNYRIENEFDNIVKLLKSNVSELLIKNELKEEEPREYIRKIQINFLKYMLDEKNINFSTSNNIWYGILDNLGEERNVNPGDYPLDEFFQLDAKEYERYLVGKFNFLSNMQIEGVSLAYGMHYLYDFLYNNKLISQEVYENILEIIEEKRKLIIRAISYKAWIYSFVYTWKKPDSISDYDYELEKEFVEKNFKEKVEFLKYMPEEYLKFLEKVDLREREEEREIAELL